MRNAAARSNLLVPEVREVMDIRQASDYLGISPDTLYKYALQAFAAGRVDGPPVGPARCRRRDRSGKEEACAAGHVETVVSDQFGPASVAISHDKGVETGRDPIHHCAAGWPRVDVNLAIWQGDRPFSMGHGVHCSVPGQHCGRTSG